MTTGLNVLVPGLPNFANPTSIGGGGGGGSGPFDQVDEYDTAPGQAEFTLSAVPNPSKLGHQVYLNGRLLRLGVDYTLASATLTFLRVPDAESFVAVYYYTL